VTSWRKSIGFCRAPSSFTAWADSSSRYATVILARPGTWTTTISSASLVERPGWRRGKKLRLFAVEAHDLALSKLARNSPVDREDVAYLARTVPLDPDTLRLRYRQELRPVIVGDPGIHDQTLAMWVAAFFPA
jgi:hypothetical protein